jgi:hypothetical protein
MAPQPPRFFNDDLTVSLSQGVVEVLEGNAGQTDLVFTVNLSSVSNHPIEVTYEIQQGAGHRDVRDRLPGADRPYGDNSRGIQHRAIRIPIVGDSSAEAAENDLNQAHGSEGRRTRHVRSYRDRNDTERRCVVEHRQRDSD